MALNCKTEDQIFTLEGKDYTYNEMRALLYDGLLERVPELTAKAREASATEERRTQEGMSRRERIAALLRGEEPTGQGTGVSPTSQALPSVTAEEFDSEMERTARSISRTIGTQLVLFDEKDFAAKASELGADAQASGAEAMFVGRDGKIYFNKARLSKGLAAHEAVHAIAFSFIAGSPQGRQILANAAKAALESSPRARRALVDFLDNYGGVKRAEDGSIDIDATVSDPELADEVLAEFVSKIYNGEIRLDSSVKQFLRDLYNRLMAALGVSLKFDPKTDDDFIGIAKDLASALKAGRKIRTPSVGAGASVRFSMPASGPVSPAATRSKVVPGKPVGTRNPTAKKSSQSGTDPNAVVDLKTMRQDEDLYRKNALLVADYPIVAARVPQAAKYARKLKASLNRAEAKYEAASSALADARENVRLELQRTLPPKSPRVKAGAVDLLEAGEESGYPVTKRVKQLLDRVAKARAESKAAKDARDARSREYAAAVRDMISKGRLFDMKMADDVYAALVDGFSANLRKLIDLFPKDLIETASLWYDGANIIAQDFARKFGTTLEQSAGVMAVLSPQKDWFMNVAFADRVMSVWKNHQDSVFDSRMAAQFLKRGGEPQPEYYKNGEPKLDSQGNQKYSKGAKPIINEDTGEITGWIGWDLASQQEAYNKALKKLDDLRGKKLKDLPLEDQAKFIRMWSEVYDAPGFAIVSPDGSFGSNKLSEKGVELKVAWGAYNTIEKCINILSSSPETEMDVISSELGEQHKVRSFYNNIVDPNNESGHVTMDTHAIAAGLWMALSGSSSEVSHNFGSGGASSSSTLGVSGTYAAKADAYRVLAKELGMLPRQVQSITWEAIRLLFPAKFKSNRANVEKVREVWDSFESGQITQEQAHDRIYQIVDEWRSRATSKGRPGKTASDAIADGTGLGVRPDWASLAGDGRNNTRGPERADDTGGLPVGGGAQRGSGRRAVRGGGGGVEAGASGVVLQPAEGEQSGPVLKVPPSDIRFSKGGERVDKIFVNLSASTRSIAGISALQDQAAAGDAGAAELLNRIAEDSLRFLLGETKALVTYDKNRGLYGGEIEPSLGLEISFSEEDRPSVLAALAKFAKNFNQEQVHVRQETSEPVGTVYEDGSYATPSYRIGLNEPMSMGDVEQVIKESGLYGLTNNEGYLEAYYVGNPQNLEEFNEFKAKIKAAVASIGSRGRGAQLRTTRLWNYGRGNGAIPYERIEGDVRTGQAQASETTRRVAERYYGSPIEPAKPKGLTPEQEALQTRIAEVYERLPLNDLSNPDVRRAYEELGKELLEQYKALPIRTEAWAEGFRERRWSRN